MLTQEVEQRLTPFAHKAELLSTIDGVAAPSTGDPRGARPTHEPLPDRSPRRELDSDFAGQSRVRRKAQIGNPHLRAALVESANAAIRIKDTYLRAQYEQVKCRRGHKRAIGAVAHSILIASYHILKDDVPCQDLGGDYYARRADPERLAKRLVAHLGRARPHRYATNVNGR
jgi:transposase